MIDAAYGKINLCLDVVGKKENGYHELKMIMVPINFYDLLEMKKASETTLSVNRHYLPINEKNTVIKAIKLMQEKYHITHGYECVLKKHIPTQAGLAGGSSDAACAIRMINKMEHLNLSDQEMLEIAQLVGSDVPFCVLKQPAYVEGEGEKLQPFYVNCDFGLLIVKPRRGVSTKAAFELLSENVVIHPDCAKMRYALEHDDYQGVVESLGNSLEEVSMKLVPEIYEIKQELLQLGFDGALMSGSGSTVFGITQDKNLLMEAEKQLHAKGYFTRVTTILGSKFKL